MNYVLCFVSGNLQHYERHTFITDSMAVEFIKKVVYSELNTVRLGYIVARRATPWTREEVGQLASNDEFDIYQ